MGERRLSTGNSTDKLNMPKFRYSNLNFDIPPAGIYVAQVAKARDAISKARGNNMIVLTVRTLPDGYILNYYLVFNGKNDGIITQFCRHCEGALLFPEDPRVDFSLTAADTLFRVVFVEVEHETDVGEDEPRAKIKFGGIISRAKALSRAPELANVKLPSNVPPPQDLAILPKEETPPKPPKPPPTGQLPDANDDDIPF
jgi:hypothetical protein